MPQLQVDTAKRPWLMMASAGFGVVVVVMLLAALALVDKPDFGWLVGGSFVATIVTAIIAGGALMAAGAWKAAASDWRRPTLVGWAVVAILSPAMGYLFLLPWTALAVSSPVVLIALYTLWKA